MSKHAEKVHIEKPWPPGMLFGILPALCGRTQAKWFEMYPPTAKDSPEKHERYRKAHRRFYADSMRKVTCKACLRLAHHHKKNKRK